MPRILLVEDDADIRFLWEHVLLDQGYQVDSAESIAAGGGLLEERAYDLVVVDGRLPDGTGVALAEAATQRGLPALVVTGYAFIMDQARQESAKYELLLKPIRPSELVAAVARILQPPG
ncbi:MAG TPA: response regulator [Stellaceae bacterium]|nr:response regulator [Stellaceae bacterium]